jgi:hypothetical protein
VAARVKVAEEELGVPRRMTKEDSVLSMLTEPPQGNLFPRDQSTTQSTNTLTLKPRAVPDKEEGALRGDR